jgi:hypothetical protein
MDKQMGKEMPWEKQREILIERVALKLPELYRDLIAVYGEDQGKRIYEELFEANFKKRSAQFQGKDIGDIMMAEVDIFPAFGWKIWVEKKEENGEPVWYEHLEKCPHLDACRKYKLPDPCEPICNMDVKMGHKHKVGKWQRLKHMPSGDSECCFRITRCK